MNLQPARSDHPCFNAAVKGTCGRVHLPVAPKCNIKCNYCNRRFDCVNENRPGVSSAVLKPHQALAYLKRVLDKTPAITVAGIAGPGDAFANPDETMETLRLVKEAFPHLLLCIATNGLNLPAHVDQLKHLGVTHVTVTVNAVDPEIAAKIYAWVRVGKVILRGVDAARTLLLRQMASLKALKEHGMAVKVNTIVIPGINDHHVDEVARTMGDLGIDIQNCMVMYPNSGTPFENKPELDAQQIAAIRDSAARYVPQMLHCTRCRADAVGLLDDDKRPEFESCLAECSAALPPLAADKPYVAVASLEGVLVNQHLGEADRFLIWTRTDSGFAFVEERQAPSRGGGHLRWLAMCDLLKDCRAVLVSAAGETPQQFLMEHDILPIEMTGFINLGLEAVYNGGSLSALKTRRKGLGGACCGSGEGCG